MPTIKQTANNKLFKKFFIISLTKTYLYNKIKQKLKTYDLRLAKTAATQAAEKIKKCAYSTVINTFR